MILTPGTKGSLYLSGTKDAVGVEPRVMGTKGQRRTLHLPTLV